MVRTLILSLGLAVVPVMALAGGGCSSAGHTEANMSCEAGSQWDAETQTCTPITSS
jgi:hypothetical protein